MLQSNILTCFDVKLHHHCQLFSFLGTQLLFILAMIFLYVLLCSLTWGPAEKEQEGNASYRICNTRAILAKLFGFLGLSMNLPGRYVVNFPVSVYEIYVFMFLQNTERTEGLFLTFLLKPILNEQSFFINYWQKSMLALLKDITQRIMNWEADSSFLKEPNIQGKALHMLTYCYETTAFLVKESLLPWCSEDAKEMSH